MAAVMESEGVFEACDFPDVAAYVRGLIGEEAALETRIHSADEMYRYDLATPYASRQTAALLYLATGRQIFRAVEDAVAWRFGGFDAVRSFLDFASGYGRTTRYLVRALAREKVTVAEIDAGAVKFQEETFRVRGVVSGARPEDFRVEGPFDAILAVSFFSHLPAARFEAWLRRLYDELAPGGMLIFSVHGMDLLPGLEMDRASGIVFLPVSETTRLDGVEYGTSYVTLEFVRTVADRVTGEKGRLIGCPFGLGGFQDVYVLVRPPFAAGPDLRLARSPWGALDGSAIENGAARAEGWAMGDSDERPPDVRLYLGDREAALSSGEGLRGSRRRWSFTFPVGAVSPDAIVRVEAWSERGLSRILVAATLRPYLPADSV
jgi:SAM-dependent methyltransferase